MDLGGRGAELLILPTQFLAFIFGVCDFAEQKSAIAFEFFKRFYTLGIAIIVLSASVLDLYGNEFLLFVIFQNKLIK